MERGELLDQLFGIFLEELEEHIRTMNAGLLALEKTPDGDARTDLLKGLFRSAHSLKGAARTVEVAPLVELCHRMEETLDAIRAGRVELGTAQLSELFAAVDAIEDTGRRLRHDQHRTSDDVGGDRAAAKPTLVVPAPVDPGAEGARAAGDTASVRVAADQLDRLVTSSSELIVACGEVAATSDDLDQLRARIAAWSARAPIAPRHRRRAPPRPTAVTSSQVLDRPSPVVDEAFALIRDLDRALEQMAAVVEARQRRLDRAAGALDHQLHRLRLLPFREACHGLDRAVRDLARTAGKRAELTVTGADVHLDRSVLQGLRDPLLHLVRNAIDHGIEPPEERIAAGKRPEGRIVIAAALRGDQVDIEVSDDGAGLDREAIRATAERRGLAGPDDEAGLARLIFEPGFSTAKIITQISGRGVGLDIVKSRVEALHGVVRLTSARGRGTRFTITTPLTVTTIRALIVEAAGRLFALPGTSIEAVMRLTLDQIYRIGGHSAVWFRDVWIPIASLTEILAIGDAPALAPGQRIPGVVVAAEGVHLVLLVDDLIAEQHTLVKSLGRRLRRLPCISGATVLATGRIALVLHTAEVVRRALGADTRQPPFVEMAPPVRRRIIVADDTATTRALEKAILEKAGYDVLVASDGDEAWQLLEEGGADLLVSDVEMPRLDGFALTAAVRASPRFGDLPVILVTGLAGELPLGRGVEVGADAYLLKGDFDQAQFLEIIAQLLWSRPRRS